jgi:hypothetical protein
MQVTPLTGTAVRDLWLSLRFLSILAATLAAGLAVSLLPPPTGADPAPVLAWGITAASLLVAAIAAGSVSTLRRRGAAAWLAAKAVPRGSILVAWGVALALPVVIGLSAAGLLGWLTLAGNQLIVVDPLAYAAVATAAGLAALQAVAIGLLCGSFGRPGVSASIAVILAAGLLIPGMVIVNEPPYLPTAGLGLLAALTSLAHPLADAVVSMGLGLGSLAALLTMGAAGFVRSNL